jgi:phosphoglycerate kinase
MEPGAIAILENTRFHGGEEKNDAELAAAMAELGDFYVNDAFSAAHRAHSSTEGIAHLLPAFAGRAMEAELDALERALGNPERPVAAVVGGAKVSTKLDVLTHLVAKVDQLIIGGGMANTFLAARGLNMQDSLVEKDALETAKSILGKAGDKLILPVDAVIADKFEAEANTQVVDADKIPAGWRMLDVGPKTLELYKKALDGAKLIVWNGPVGVFEFDAFAHGTETIARAIAASPAFSIAGGGDTLAAIAKYGIEKDISYISTGGGAFLEVLEGRTLPAFEILARRAAQG